MKKWPPAVISFEVPLYSGMVYLYDSDAQFARALACLGKPPPDGPAAGRCHQLVNDVTGEVIYLVGWYNQERSTLAHETAHLALFVLERAGIDARESRGEAFCYLLGDLLERLGIDQPTRPAGRKKRKAA